MTEGDFEEMKCFKHFEANMLLTIALSICGASVLSLAILNAFNPPYWDEAWRMLLIQEKIPANNTLSPLFFRFLSHWPLPVVRIFSDIMLLLSSMFLSYAMYVYTYSFRQEVIKYRWCFLVAPFSFQLLRAATFGSMHNQIPDYETFPCFLLSLSFGAYLLCRTFPDYSSRNRIQKVCGLLIGLSGITVFFSSTPAIAFLPLLCILILFHKQWYDFLWTIIGCFLGVFVYFSCVQAPTDFFIFFMNATHGALTSEDSHSLKNGVIYFLAVKTPYLFYRSFLDSSPFFLGLVAINSNYLKCTQKKNIIVVVFMFLFVVSLAKYYKLTWSSEWTSEPYLNIVPFMYSLATTMFLLLVSEWINVYKIIPKNGKIYLEIGLDFVALLLLPICARMGSNLPINAILNLYIFHLFLFSLILAIILRQVLFQFLMVFVIVASCVLVCEQAIRFPPYVLQKKVTSLTEFGQKGIYMGTDRFLQLQLLKKAMDGCDYCIANWEDWSTVLILRKKALAFDDFHYVQYNDIAELIKEKGIPLSSCAFLISSTIFNGDKLLTEERFNLLLEKLDAEISTETIVGRSKCYTVRIRNK